MRLRVVAEGSEFGTKVVDSKTGESVDGVTAVAFAHAAGDIPCLVLRVHDFEADVEAESVRWPHEPQTTPAPPQPAEAPVLHGTVPILLVYKRCIPSHAIERLRKECESALAKGGRKLIVLDDGPKVYQFIDGRWVPLDGGDSASPEEVVNGVIIDGASRD